MFWSQVPYMDFNATQHGLMETYSRLLRLLFLEPYNLESCYGQDLGLEICV